MDQERLRQAVAALAEQANALLAELDAQNDHPPPAVPGELLHFSMLSS